MLSNAGWIQLPLCQLLYFASASPFYFFPFLLHKTHQVLIHGLHKFKTDFFDQMESLKET